MLKIKNCKVLNAILKDEEGSDLILLSDVVMLDLVDMEVLERRFCEHLYQEFAVSIINLIPNRGDFSSCLNSFFLKIKKTGDFVDSSSSYRDKVEKLYASPSRRRRCKRSLKTLKKAVQELMDSGNEKLLYVSDNLYTMEELSRLTLPELNELTDLYYGLKAPFRGLLCLFSFHKFFARNAALLFHVRTLK